MALDLDGTGYVGLANRLVGSFPCTLLGWFSKDSSGASHFWMSQSQASADRYIAAWQLASSVTKFITHQAPGVSSSKADNTAPDANATLQPCAIVFAGVNDWKICFGDTNFTSDTATLVDNLNLHDRFTIGGLRYNGNAPQFLMDGSAAEVHGYAGALSAAQLGDIFTGVILPEDAPGWVDGVTLEFHQPSGNYLSITGTRTFVASGGVTQSALAHPVTRAAPSTDVELDVGYTEASDTVSVSVAIAGGSATATVAYTEASDTVAAPVQVGATLTTRQFRNNTGPTGLHASVANVALNIYNATTGALVLRLTGLTTNAQGRLVVTNAALSAGTTYAYEADFSVAGLGRRLPTVAAV